MSENKHNSTQRPQRRSNGLGRPQAAPGLPLSLTFALYSLFHLPVTISPYLDYVN